MENKVLNGLTLFPKRYSVCTHTEKKQETESITMAPIPLEKDINFYDYDGTLLYSYTIEEFQQKGSCPPLPQRPGLICRGWNWDYEDIIEWNDLLDVGAEYDTEDGKTRLYVYLEEGDTFEPIQLDFTQSKQHGVLIDWGDGSQPETIKGIYGVNPTHTYNKVGEYVITLEPLEDCTYEFGVSGSYANLFGHHFNENKGYKDYILKRAELGRNITRLGQFFYGCVGLETVVLPSYCDKINTQMFYSCSGLKYVTIPKSVTSFYNEYDITTIWRGIGLRRLNLPKKLIENTTITEYMFSNSNIYRENVFSKKMTTIPRSAYGDCSKITYLSFPNNIETIGENAFQQTKALRRIDFGGQVGSIKGNAFYYTNLQVLNLSNCTEIPTLESTSAFSNTSMKIHVPSALYEEWKTATNWSSFASRIVAV